MRLPSLNSVYLTTIQKRNIKRYLFELPQSKLNIVNKELKKIIKNKKLSNIQKGEKIYDLIYSLRYPTIASTMKKFNAIAHMIYKKTGLKIQPPENFEGNNLKSIFYFNSIKDLKNKLKSVSRNIKHFKSLFKSFTTPSL